MKREDVFEKLHPAVSFVYFSFIVLVTAFFMNPIVLLISFFGAFTYAAYTEGFKGLKNLFGFLVPLCVAAAVINPAFSHMGVTILCYLPSGNPLTAESIIYGIFAALLIAATVLWFRNINRTFTSDKFIYLFGKIAPALSLILSMILRFVPQFKKQLKRINEAQSTIGCNVHEGNILKRIKNGITVLSVLITWSLENSLDTADSMRSRGYGTSKRTAYAIYKFEDRDRNMLICILLCGAVFTVGILTKSLYYRYFPSIKLLNANAATVIFLLSFVFLTQLPVVYNCYVKGCIKNG